MPTFTGDSANNTITPTTVSAGVTAVGATTPGVGADTIDGGAGADTLAGGGGADLVLGGDGDDSIAWSLGDGSDTVDGGAGLDTQSLTAGTGADAIDVEANADHVLASVRGAPAVDAVNVETLAIKPLAGSDTVTVGDLTGTAVRTVNIDLSGATAGQADNAADSVTLNEAAGVSHQLSIVLQAGGHALTAVDNAGGVTTTTNVTALDGKDQVAFELGGGNDNVAISGPASKAHIFVDAGDGNDTVQAAAGSVIVDGEQGNDVLISAEGAIMQGSEGDDTLTGASNDVLDGGDGNDLMIAGNSTRAFGDAGDDTFIIPTGVNGAQLSGGDGNDTFQASEGNVEIHGDAGDDTVVWTMNTPQTSNSLIDGGDGNDTFKLVSTQDDHAATIELAKTADGFDDIHVVRDFPWPSDQGTDADLFVQNTEHIQIVSGRGADTIVVQDQAGLGVQQIDLDLGAAASGGPDGQRDVASIEATGDADHAAVTTVAGGIAVSGLGASVTVTDIDHSASVTDQVRVAASAGDDVIDLSAGADRAQLAALVIDGGDGVDTVNIAGSSAGEAFVMSSTSDGASVSVGGASLGDLVNVETVNIATNGGGDSVVVNDLTGSGVQTVNIDLAGAVAGQPDGVHERVTFEDLGASDQIYVTQSADGHSLQAGEGQTSINVVNLDNQDQVIFHGEAGDDTIVASGAASSAQITLNGQDGNDLVVGGNGTEFLFGEAGNDTLQGGSGRNIMDGGDGNDLIINADGSIGVGGAGDDTLQGSTNDVIQAGDGNDLIQLGLSTQVTAGAGNDTITATATTGGGSTTDAGDGNDVFLGVSGNLVFHGGAGDDTMQWNMGADISSNTLLEGGAGADSLSITGPQDAKSWSITVGDNGTGFELVQMDHAGLTAKLFTQNTETVSFGAGQGADTIVVKDQTGLGVQQMNIDLGASASGGADGQKDSLTLNGSATADQITVSQANGQLVVAGLPATITVHDIDHGAVSDSVTVATGAGDDVIDFSALNDLQGVVTVDTGAGNDTVVGGQAGVTFAFHGGDASQDVFIGFQGGGVDHIHIAGSADHSLADLVANGHIAQSGADVVITDGAGTTLTLTGVSLGSLTGSDFLFG